MSLRPAQMRPDIPRELILWGLILASGCGLVACQDPPPRSYSFFMEDRIAREGTLVRCDSEQDDVQRDIECANAQRAAVELALQAERARAAELEVESERRIAQLRVQLAESERQAREAEIDALRRELEAYESMWRSQNREAGDNVAAGGLNGSPRIAE